MCNFLSFFFPFSRFWDSEGGKYDHTKIETEEKKKRTEIIAREFMLRRSVGIAII